MPVVFVILFIAAALLAISALFVSVVDVHVVNVHVSQSDAPQIRSSSSSSSKIDTAARMKQRRQRRRRMQREGRRQLLLVDDNGDEDILDEEEFIIAKAFAETYGRMAQCNTDVVGKDCIANIVEEMDRVRRRQLQNLTFAAVHDESDNDNDEDGHRRSDPSTYSRYIVPPDHPYPWWFTTCFETCQLTVSLGRGMN